MPIILRIWQRLTGKRCLLTETKNSQLTIYSWDPRPTAPQVHWSVVHEMPNQPTNNAVLALVDLSGLDNFLLQRRWNPPIDHVTRTFVLVRSHNEASIMWTQARGKHA